MKALTLYQPWATLVALGVKTIETRSWATKYRGPLAIHAGARRPAGGTIGTFGVIKAHDIAMNEYPGTERCLWSEQGWHPLSLGAIVATCTLVDVVPILAGDRADRIDWADLPYPRIESRTDFGPDWPDGWLDLWHSTLGSSTDPENDGRSIPDQATYGDFTPGRFGWLLADVVPLDPPIPAKGRQGLWAWSPDAEVAA